MRPAGGGGGGSNAAGGSGTATQYFSKRAVGNTWTYLEGFTTAITGQPTSTIANTKVKAFTSESAGVVQFTNTYISNGGSSTGFGTYQIDANGALVEINGSTTDVLLPANFSVGTTWDMSPANPAVGISAIKATVAAFNVTRTLPAGTFNDCLQVNLTFTVTIGAVIATAHESLYYSPTVGAIVEDIGTASASSNGSTTSITFTSQLQAGYVANVIGNIRATANTTPQNLTVGVAMMSFSPLTASGGASPYTYSYTGTLPSGLSFNSTTGVVTGTPLTTYAAANLVFSVKDANNVMASTTSTVSFSATTVMVGTAAQYFTKKAVGNTWTWVGSGQQNSVTTTSSEVMTVTASTGSVVTVSDTYTSDGTIFPANTVTIQIDSAGAWVATVGTFHVVLLPGTFSVGTTWEELPADPVSGAGAINATLAAFNVTRTVPAGTFTDCLQVNTTQSFTTVGGTVTTNSIVYYSPTAGLFVDRLDFYPNGGTNTTQLQAGYIANP